LQVHLVSNEHFVVVFDDDEEFKTEYANNISVGGLCLPVTCELAPLTPIQLTLKSGGRQITLAATVVYLMESAFAVSFAEKPGTILTALQQPVAEEKLPPSHSEQNVWDKVRNLSRMEKLLLAPKAERSERGVLLQDNDAQVLYALLKNPRITTEEVVRIARSPLLAATTADLIAKTTIWVANSEIRSALVHNPRTPTPLALKLLPTLPEPEIRQIAKASAVSQSLRQAALRIVIKR